MCKQVVSDKLQGVIRNPFAFYFPIQRGFSGPIQTLGSVLGDWTPIVLHHNVLRGLREPLRFHGNDMSVVWYQSQKS